MDKANLERINAILDAEIQQKEVHSFLLSSFQSEYEYAENSGQKIKDVVSEFEKKTRSIVGSLNKIHGTSLETRKSKLL